MCSYFESWGSSVAWKRFSRNRNVTSALVKMNMSKMRCTRFCFAKIIRFVSWGSISFFTFFLGDSSSTDPFCCMSRPIVGSNKLWDKQLVGWQLRASVCLRFSRHTKSVMLWGTYRKHAYRYGFSPNANCPICPCTDSALHILSGCQHTKMRNMTIKHNMASVLIVQALQKGPCGANQIA